MFYVVNLLIILLSVLNVYGDNSEKQWLFQPESKWDKEWKSGSWEYLETIAVERSRIAVIGGVLIQMFAPSNASVLDVGCGEGSISDFLNPQQRPHYVGIDLSKEAIQIAKQKRGPPLRFVHSAAHLFHPVNKFDVIVFSDVLYYVEHEKVISQYIEYLNPNGIMIISIFHQSEKLMYEMIFKYAKEKLNYLDEMEVSGYTKKNAQFSKEKTAFHIEAYRKKN